MHNRESPPPEGVAIHLGGVLDQEPIARHRELDHTCAAVAAVSSGPIVIDRPTTAESWRLSYRAARGVHLGLRAHACGGLDFERRQVSVAVSYDEDRASSEVQDRSATLPSNRRLTAPRP